MFKLIGVVVIIVVLAVLGLAATRPDTFRVSRSARIHAPAEAIFPLINDLRAFRTWSPFENKDPAMKRTFDGPASGAGAVYHFAGNSQVGRGRLEIVRSAPPSAVDMQLDMLAPVEGHNIIEFTLAPDGDATRVIWTMHGPMGFVPRVMSVFINMDRMVGTDFEAGLASLGAAAEAQPKQLTREADNG